MKSDCLDWNMYKDIVVIIGDNDSGKTSIIQWLFLKRIDNKNTYVINSSHEASWKTIVPEQNIFSPSIFNIKWLQKVLLLIASSNSKQITIVIDDIDNFNVKEDKIFKSLIINLRHLNVGLIISSRTMSDLPKNLYKQARYSLFGYQSSDYDMYYIATIIGYDTAKTLKLLPDYVFLKWDRKKRSADKVMLDPKIFKKVI